MRKIVLLLGLFIVLLSVTESSAQIKYGVKGGLNLSCVGFDEENIYSINNRAGFFVGPTVLMATPIKEIELDASLLFDQRGVETESPDLSAHSGYKTTTTLRQIAIPINLRYNLSPESNTRLFVFAGPQLGLNVGKKESELDNGDMVFDTFSFSMNLGIGMMLSQHIQVSANYNFVCGKNAGIWINRQWGSGKQINKSRFNAWQFSVGYYF